MTICERLPRFARNDIHSRVIARSASDMAIPVVGNKVRLPRFARNDRREITGNDTEELLNFHEEKLHSESR